ncbi:hypothetical protein [Amycolatopsis sp. MtRt-6]|nr:hypothetical protein [Amycolatopsis sp. MtRt-6]
MGPPAVRPAVRAVREKLLANAGEGYPYRDITAGSTCLDGVKAVRSR